MDTASGRALPRACPPNPLAFRRGPLVFSRGPVYLPRRRGSRRVRPRRWLAYPGLPTPLPAGSHPGNLVRRADDIKEEEAEGEEGKGKGKDGEEVKVKENEEQAPRSASCPRRPRAPAAANSSGRHRCRSMPARTTRRPAPCASCLRSAFSGHSEGTCWNLAGGIQRCERCWLSHNLCRALPSHVAPFAMQLTQALERQAPPAELARLRAAVGGALGLSGQEFAEGAALRAVSASNASTANANANANANADAAAAPLNSEPETHFVCVVM
ncbi:hypothetical protein F4803DRAFT_554161 [Xylaria telfairii]|nr:hypothetical protein F4803DRAFT_554161 [Xylaria telfairii]